MIDIVVREMSAAPDGSFAVHVDFGDQGGAEVRVSAPVDESGEKLLAWYFEDHLRFPFLDKDLERKAAELVTECGRNLFRQVFAGEAAFGYRRARDGGFEGYRLVVRGSAGFQQLHWEALSDPDTGDRLALRMPVVRQDARTPLSYELPAPAPTLNILVVTARPSGSRDVGYRTISEPLLDAIGQAGLPATVDLVRPGTWEALREALRAAEREHGQGWYQVVHFDVHGGFGTPSMMAGSAGTTPRYLFDPASMPPDVNQGFLFFETATAGTSHPVPSAQVARLLAEHRVAVAVLNACQSAKQTGAEASLAQDLVAAGAPVAVGMAYSVTVTAAKQAMPVLYGRLAAGDDPVRAAFEARRSLHDVKARQGYFEQELDLEDWILPVVFAQRDSRLTLRAMTSAERELFYRRRDQVAVQPLVEYGFVGRDLDLHALERLLLTDPRRSQVLVRGMAGAGKSTLLAHAGWWWQRTGLVDQVFAFSYEQRAWTAEQIIRHIARDLLTPVEFVEWEAMGDAAKSGMVTDRLRATRHLIVIDNAESITASPAAIPHALPEADRERLARWLAGLRGGRTLLLVGSREDETWLAGSTFAGSVYELPGLDPQAASDLLDRILRRHGGSKWLTDTADKGEQQALKDLMRVLDGYPLPMTVVLPNLATTAPTKVLEELQGGEDSADPTMAARRAIEYSHGKLDPALQHSLQLLAPFTASIPTVFLDAYTEALRAELGPQALDHVDLAAAVTELQRVGLAIAHSALVGFVQIVPVLPFFLRNRLRDQPELVRATGQAHYRLYTGVGAALRDMLMSNDPNRRATGQAATAMEYANLTAAVGHGLSSGQLIMGLVSPLETYLDQVQQQNASRGLIDDVIAGYLATNQHDHQWELGALHNLAGSIALTQHRLEDAYRHHQTELAIADAIGERRNQGATYNQLGRVAEEQRRFELAEQHYRQALDIKAEFGDRHSAAITYHQLGRVAQEQRRFELAEQHYRQALDIKVEFGDRHSAAITHHQLGMVAQEQRRFEQAEQHYRQALDIKVEFGDRYSAASTYHQLGMVAEWQGRFGLAEQHYRQALDILLEFRDRHSAASTYHQLGIIAQAQGRFEQAEQHYQQALDIKLEFGDRHNAASTYHQLGTAAHEQGRFEQAERHYWQALDILLEFGDRHPAASTYLRLGEVLSGLGNSSGAIDAFLNAAVTWHTSTNTWSDEVLDLLGQERTSLSEMEFQQAVDEIIPVQLRNEFRAAFNARNQRQNRD